MRTGRVWRYYCDFCKKSGCSSWHMQKHEDHCTMNPDRKCGWCKRSKLTQLTLDELLDAKKKGVDELEKVTHGCPGCMLSTFKQWEDLFGHDMPWQTEWEYDKAIKKFRDKMDKKDCLTW